MNQDFFQKYFILLLSFLVLASCGETPPWGDDINKSFRGVKWGSSLEDNSRLHVQLSLGEKMQEAVREDEDLRFGEAELDKVTYIFLNRGLKQVKIDFSGYQQFSKIKFELQKLLGEPRIEAQTERNTWKKGEMVVVLRFYKMPHQGELSFFNNKDKNQKIPETGSMNTSQNEAYRTACAANLI